MARINRESITTLIVDARGASAGAAEFDRAAAKIRSANTIAQRITERTNVILGEQGKAFKRLVREIDPATLANERFAKHLKTLDSQFKGATGLPEYHRLLGLLEAKYKNTGEAARRFAAEQENLKRRAQSLMETIHPQERAQRQYNEAIQNAQELHWKGAISLNQYNEALAHAEVNLRRAKGASDDFGSSQADSARLAARRITQLSPQISDIVTQAMSGTNPFTILVQQGPQIADIWGGIPTVLAKVPPHVYAIGAAFLVLGTAAALTASRLSEISAQARTLDSIGRTLNPQVAGMAKELRGLTLAMTTEGVSRGDAMKAVEQLARTKVLQAELYASIASVTPDVANALGTDAPGAAKELAEAFSTGANGVRDLDDKLRFLSPAMLKTIELMDRSGNRMGAMRLAMRELTKTYEGEALKQMSAWERMTTAMGNAWDALWEKIAASPQAQAFMRDFANVADMITRALRGTGTAAAGAASGIKATTAEVQALSGEIFRLQKEANAAQAEGFRLLDAGDPAADAVLDRAADLASQMQAAQAKLKELRAGSSGSETPGTPTLTGLSESEQKRVNSARTVLDAETEALKANRVQRQINMAGHQAFEAAIAGGRSAQEAAAMADQARERAIRDLNIAIMDENEALDLNAYQTLRVADAYRVSAEEAIRADAMRQAAIDHMNTGADVAERANRLLRGGSAQAYEAVGRSFNVANQDLASQGGIAIASRGSVAEQQAAERRAEAEAMYRDALSKASAVQNNDQQINALLAERDAYVGLLEQRDRYTRQTSTIASMRRGLEDTLGVIEKELELVGKSNVERDRELGLLRIRQSLVAAGYSGQPLEDEIERLEKINALIAERSEQTRRATEAFERDKQAWMETAGIMRDGFEDLVMNGESFADVLRNISRALLQLGMDVMVMNPLKDAMTDMLRGGSGMTPGSYTPPAGSGPWGTVMSLAQTGINMYGGWSAGTGASLMPNAANDAGALSAGALLENWKMYPVAHSGWEVGSGSPPQMRAAPDSVFVKAPRFHKGGLASGERAIIAQDGEEILAANNPRHRRNFRNGGGQTVVLNITTPDANSFRQSQGQITAAAARSLSIAGRRNG